MAKKKKGGPEISNTEWGMAISALAIIDVVQFGLDWIGIPFVLNAGTVLNRFIDIGTGLAWTTYLKLRGINLDAPKIMGLIITFFLEEIPDIDALPLWTADGVFMYISVKAEKELEKVAEVGVAVAAVALAPETGGASLAAEGAIEGGVAAGEAGAAAEGAAGVAESGEAVAEAGGSEAAEGGEKTAAQEGAEDQEEGGEEKSAGETEKEQKEKEGEETPEEKNKKEEVERGKKKSGARSGLNPSNSRGGPDETRESEKKSARTRSNLLDLSLSYGERKKQKEEEDETSFSE